MQILEQAIANKDLKLVRELVQKIPFANLADEVEKLDISQQLVFFRMLETATAAKIFSWMETSFQKKLINAMSSEEAIKVFDELYSDEAVDLLEEVPANIAKMILENTSKEKRAVINKLLSYKDDEIGSIMHVDITFLKNSWNCKRALAEIKRFRRGREVTSLYFIKNSKNLLVGMVNIEDLIFSSNSTLISSLMQPITPLHTHDDVEQASFIFKDQDLPVLPVINAENILVGVVTSDDIIDIIEQEFSEDLQKMAGIEPLEKPYFASSILNIVKSRIFWLLSLMISATISQIVLQVFMDITTKEFGSDNSNLTITTAISTLLVTIIPVISGAAGNAGSQSSTTITRALAIKEIGSADYWRVLWREFRIGFLVGSLLAIANFIRLMIYYAIQYQSLNSAELQNWSWYTVFWIAFGSSFSLIIVVTIAKIVGGLLPLIAKLLNQDPAVMAAPLIATLTDALSSVMFFTINILILLIVL